VGLIKRILSWFKFGLRRVNSYWSHALTVTIGVAVTIFFMSDYSLVMPIASRSTYGAIVVAAPKVYSRERLVNDRFRQENWLKGKLDATDTLVEQGKFAQNQIAYSERNVLRFAGGVTGRTDRSNPERKNDDAKDEEADSAGNASRTKTEMTRLRPSPNTVHGTMIDEFRDINAYREEVRSELMQTQLDDSHDIAGNTLYRLNFDATIIPGRNSKEIVIIKVEIDHDNQSDHEAARRSEYKEIYEEWRKHLQAKIDTSVAGLMVSFGLPYGSSLEGEKTYTLLSRFIHREIEESVPRKGYFGDGTKIKEILDLFSILHAQVVSTRAINQFKEQLQNYLANLSDEQLLALDICDRYACGKYRHLWDKEKISILLRKIYQSETCRVSSTSLRGIRTFVDGIAFECPQLGGPHDSLFAMMAFLTRAQQAHSGFLSQLRELFPLDKAEIGQRIQNTENLDMLLGPPSPGEIADVVAKFKKATLFGKNANDDYNELADFAPVVPLRCLFTPKITGCGHEACRLTLEPLKSDHQVDQECRRGKSTQTFIKWFDSLLNDHAKAFAYGVTPRQLSERISALLEDQVAARLGLAAAVGAPDVANAETVLKFLRDKAQTIEAIRRHPLVVGFGDFRRANSQTGQSAGSQTTAKANFGWVISPHFDLTGGSGRGTHITVQHSLAAMVSVPSWWKSMRVTISQCWISEVGHEAFMSTHGAGLDKWCPPHDDTRKPVGFKVQLPGSVAEIDQKLRVSVIQEPYLVQTRVIAEQGLEEGRNGRVVLEGGRLWKSPVVTLGNQVADEIEVLPNMGGIVAKFGCISPLPESSGGAQVREKRNVALPVTVWTSEGHTDPIWISIHEWKQRASYEEPCYRKETARDDRLSQIPIGGK
jgi:hypothetical protein